MTKTFFYTLAFLMVSFQAMAGGGYDRYSSQDQYQQNGGASAWGNDRSYSRASNKNVYFDDWANVVNVVPVYAKTNRPQQECYDVYSDQSQSQQPQGKSYVGSVIGGVAGGLLGSQVGKGNGKVASAAVGAAVGAIVGDSIDNAPTAPVQPQSQVRQECRNVDNYYEEMVGYNVEYDYYGQRGVFFAKEKPYNKVRVKVSVQPN